MLSLGGRAFLILILFWLFASAAPSNNRIVPAISGAAAQESRDAGDVFFGLNEFTLSSEDEAALADSVKSLKENPSETVIIEGYSDITGDDEYNLNLSRRRADAVKRFYVSKGIETGRIEVSGNGKTDRFSAGTEDESLRLNRRVRVTVAASRNEAPAAKAPADAASSPPSAVEGEIIEAVSVETAAPPPSEPASEPVEPSIGDLVSPPPDLSRAIEKSMRKLASGRIMFDAPMRMEVGESYAVEAVVSYKFLKDLSGNLNAAGSSGNTGLTVSRNLSLHLRGPGFDVSPVHDTAGREQQFPIDDVEDTKTLAEDSTAKWIWNVVPLKSGFRSLSLNVEITVEDAQYNQMINEYQIFQKVIQIKPNIIHTLTRSYLLMAVTTIIVVAAVGWVLIKKLKLG